LYVLGLRNGDVVLSINGYSLASYDDAATAMAELYIASSS
jgi:type II secretory pathway component PulC